MKYLALTSTALFLLAAPGMALAQTATGSAGAGAGAGVTTDTGTGAGAGVGASGDAGIGTGAPDSNSGGNGDTNADTNNQVGGESQCSDETATSSYDSFSEKCRHQLDAWAASQSGKSATFEGDVVVGAVVPDTVEIIEVPAYHNYGYVMLNEHRVLVDRGTRKVIRVY